MKKFYEIIVIAIVLFLKTPLCCAQDKEGCALDKEQRVEICLRLPIDSLPRQFQFPETPLACCEAYFQNTHSPNPLGCLDSCLPTPCFTRILAYIEPYLPTCLMDPSDYFNISQDSNFSDSVKNSIEIRKGLWSMLSLYDNASDLSPTQREMWAQYLNKSYELCKTYDHPAKEMLLFVSRILMSSQEKIQTNIRSYLTTSLQAPEQNNNLDMVELKLSSIHFLSDRVLDKKRIMLLANQLITAHRAEIAAQHLYAIGAGAMLIDGNYKDYKDYLLLAAEHGHTGARNLLVRINADKN